MKKILNSRILNGKIKFILGEILDIAKHKFHDVIINNIKRKRQISIETTMTNRLGTKITQE